MGGVVIHAVAGLIFGIGLVISGMVDPTKVQNFLDIAGTWDPSLAFVMGAAVVVTFLGYRLAFRRPAPLLDDHFDVSGSSAIDWRLLLGAGVFGIGWGLAGYCPGPALTALSQLAGGTLAFVIAMLVGIALVRLGSSRQ